MGKNTTPQSSTRFLLFLFLIALPVSILIRWDASPWLDNQIQNISKQAGFNIQYKQLAISGLGIKLDELKINKTNMSPLQFENLQASISIDSLLSGNVGVDIQALWQTNPISFTIAQDGDSLQINHLDTILDMNHIPQLTTSLPASISGIVTVKGDIRLHPNIQQLETGNLNITWNQAKAGLTQPEFTLGDYQLKLYSDEKNNQPWHWDISGGSGVALQGNGTFSPQQPDPKSWTIHGFIAATVDQTNPSLAMMMQTMMGKTAANVRISGTLGNPRTEMIR